MDLKITSLGSGSKGNSCLISYKNNGILIDAGFSKKKTLERICESNIDFNIVKYLLLTHEHSDHISGSRVIADGLDICTYANESTAKFLKEKENIGKKVKIFNSGGNFRIEDFKISTFRLSHDALDTVGYFVNIGEINIGYAMDLGHVDNVTKRYLRECDIIVFESNHDISMLMNSQRDIRLKMRIKDKRGHLSNDQAMNALDEIVTDRTKVLMLGHLSGECNNHSLVEKTASKKLSDLKRTDIKLYVLSQSLPFSYTHQ